MLGTNFKMTKNTLNTLTAFLALTAVIVCFGFNSSTVDSHASQSLDSIVQQLDSLTDYKIHLSGHTDNIGSDNYNDKLSKERVIAVKNYLISKNIDSTRITFDFYGERKPTVPNTSDDNRALNRRVELTISGQKSNTAPQQTTFPEQQSKDSINPQKRDSAVIVPVEKEIKKKKNKRRLIWTGWRTGFHWSTPGKD